MCQLSLPNIVFEQMENLRHRKGKGLRRVREWWQGKGRKARVLQTYSSSHKALICKGPTDPRDFHLNHGIGPED